jgi:hypothetical protein
MMAEDITSPNFDFLRVHDAQLPRPVVVYPNLTLEQLFQEFGNVIEEAFGGRGAIPSAQRNQIGDAASDFCWVWSRLSE